MHQRQRRHQARVLQILVVLAHLVGKQQAFVHQRARRHRRHIELLAVLEPERLNGVARRLADDVELALERVGHRHVAAAADEHLADHRFYAFSRYSQPRVVARHVAPAEQHLLLVLDGALDFVFAGEARSRFLRQKHHAHAVFAHGRKLHALGGHFLAQEPVRDLDQDAGAVAGQGVGADRAAMGEVLENEQPLIDDGVAPGAFDVGDKADAAGVMFIGGVVQPLCRRTNKG